MQFHVRTRRQPPAVIVVALIDVLVVLVIFLVVTTTFKQQPALKLALPDSTQAKREGANERPPLVVYIDKQGSLRLGGEARPVRRRGRGECPPPTPSPAPVERIRELKVQPPACRESACTTGEGQGGCGLG